VFGYAWLEIDNGSEVGFFVLSILLELERVLCKFASYLAQILTRVEPHKLVELAWTVIQKIRDQFIHISSFNQILVLWCCPAIVR